MIKFKKEIRNRRITFSIISALAACACVFDYLVSIGVVMFKPENARILAFQTGFLIGIFFVALAIMLRYASAQKDPKKLQRLYYEEHDERRQLIKRKAGMPMLGITSGVLVFAGVFAGYFNNIVFYTLVAAAAVQMLIAVSVKLYYTKTMEGAVDENEELATEG